MSPTLERFEVRGLSLACHRWGDPTKPTILLFHGFLDHGLSFAPVAQALSDEFSLVAADFRGHGLSDWVGAGGYYHFPDYFDDVSRLVDHLALDSFGVLAHSMGGSIGLALAVLAPSKVRGLVLLEGFGPPAESLSQAPNRLKRFVHALRGPDIQGPPAERRLRRRAMASIEEAAGRLRNLNPRLSQERALQLAGTATEPVEGEAVGGKVVWRFDPLHRTPAARPFNVEEYLHLLRAVQAPVLALYGGESAFSREEIDQRHACLGDLRTAFVEGAGHNIHHDRPDLVAAVTRQWFAGDRRGSLPAGIREPARD